MNLIAERLAAWHLVAEGYFGVGEEILFGKYKNMRGKIVGFGQDDRGIPTVEIEPVPKGRKQNKTLGLYKIWKAEHRKKKAGHSKEACIVFSKKCDGNVILGKVRDRMYDPKICIYHLERDGTEMCVMFDHITGFCEGVNEHGIGIVTSTLMVLQDAMEGVADGDNSPERSPDGIKILKALTYDKVGDVLQSLILHKPEEFKRGLKGHTLVSDGDKVFALENTRIHAPKSMSLDADKVHTRTNHGIYYPGAGYTKGPDYVSSIVRRWEAQKQLEKAQHTEDLMPALTQSIDKVPSAFSPTRFTDKMRTTSQMAIDPKAREIRLYLVPDHVKFDGIKNKLPGGRKPKIRAKIFKYPSKDKLQDTSITVPEEMSMESAKKAPADSAKKPEGMAARVAARALQANRLPGGLADEKKPGDFDQSQLSKGTKVEMEHTDDPAVAREVAMDHLTEDPKYYDKLETIEKHGRYKSKKKVKTQDGDDMTVYEYSDRQIADRNRGKAERIEKLRKSMKQLQTKVRKDVQSKDEKVRDVALAVGLMDETFERVGNDGSAKEGHFGVTTWRVKHVKFGKGGVTISYVGKSGVGQKKKVSNPRIVGALKKVCKDKSPDDCVLNVSAAEVNEYLKGLGITAKDIRGFHANTEMKTQLKKVRKGKLPADPKEKEKRLKDEFDKALEATAEEVGHEASTLKSQYLVPGLEDDYKRDGTINESHTKKGAEVGTDTATIVAIAPEMLRDLYDDPKFQALSQMFGGDGPGAYEDWRRMVQQHGGAVFETGADGSYDVKIVPEPTGLHEHGLRPPYGTPEFGKTSSLRQAAEQGTETERRILANAVHAPVLVIRDRSWWLENAPNIYRFAREHEKVRPTVPGLHFDPQVFSVLWYEDADGNNLGEPQYSNREAPVEPEGAKYQLSQFPNYLRDSMLRLNDDGTSTAVMEGNRGFPEDLVTAMVRTAEWDVGDAIMVAAQSCERCLNVLCQHYLGVDEGYKFGSEPYWKCGTSCKMCDHVGKTATKSDAEAEEEQVQKMLRNEPKKKPPRYDLRDNRTLDEDDDEDLGGGDGGDRDLSMKWTKVGMARRISFQWLATPRGVSGARLAMMHLAEAAETAFRPPGAPQPQRGPKPPAAPKPPAGARSPGGAKPSPGDSEFDAWAKPQSFKHPETGNEVGFTSLPTPEQKKIRDKWRASQGKTEEDEGEKGKQKEEPERTRENIDADLQSGRDDIDELKDSIQEAKSQISESEKAIKKLKKKLQQPEPEPGARQKETQARIDDLMSQAREAVPALKQRGKEIDAVSDKRDELKKKTEADARHIDELKKSMDEPAAKPGEDKEKIQARIEEEKGKLEEAKAEREGLDEELDALEEKGAGFETSKKELKKLIRDLESQLQHINPDHPQTEVMRDGIREARRDLREATFQGKRAKKDLAEKTKRLEDLRQQTEDGEKLIEKLEGAVDAPEEAGEAPQDRDALKAEIDSRRAKLREDQGELKDLDDGIKEKEKEYTALRGQGRELAKSIKQLEAQKDAPGADPESHEALQEKIKEERKKQRELEDEIEEKKGDLSAAQNKVKDHEEERRDPDGRKKKQEDAANKEREKKVKEAIARTTKAMGTLLGEDSNLSSQTQKEISAHLGGMDESQLEQFALDFENDLGDLTKKDPKSAEVNDIANGVAKMGFSTEGIRGPEALATRLAQIAYTRNVIANPMITGGKPVGRTEMDDVAAKSARAREAFDQFQGLNAILRNEAAGRIAAELRGLDSNTHKAKELEAILTGISTAQVVDTGEALRGRPQPTKGTAALVRKMVEQGEVDQVFAPAEDMFSPESQKAFEGALGGMDAEELGSFIVGDDKDHPYVSLVQTMVNEEGDPAMKEFIGNFLREDWMQDIWADRAMRDVMEANDDPLSDDPEHRAQAIAEAKEAVGERRQQRMEAINRIQDAQDAGEETDEKDVALAKGLDPEDGAALRENAGGILDKLKGMGKRIMSPAVAVLNHFRNTGEADVKKTETQPHPDEKAKEPRSKEERDEAKMTRRELLTGPKTDEGEEEPTRVQLKSERLKLKSQRDKVKPEERAKFDEKIKQLDERLEEAESGKDDAEDRQHGPGDVWKTPEGNWRAKNEDGVSDSFKSKEKAEMYAKRDEEYSADFSTPFEERGPTRFASDKVAVEVAEVWLGYMRSIHPDDPNRPIVFLNAA